jgi:predicted nucleic acid-binding protein
LSSTITSNSVPSESRLCLASRIGGSSSQRLGSVELHSALALKMRTGHLDRERSAALRIRFLNDVSSGAIALVAVTELHYPVAESLIIRYGDRKGLRTLDALQLAVVLDVQHRAGLDALVVADTAFADVARIEGISVINPEAS